MSRLSRRGFLGVVAAGGFVTGLTACGVDFQVGQTAALVTSAGRLPTPFRVPLPVPPVKRPARTDATTDYYEITQREADVEILPGTRTRVFGYDGIFPGPTIESTSGRRIVVHHTNDLPVPTVVHLHGGRTPTESDGYPTDLVLPAAAGDWVRYPGGRIKHRSFDYTYPLDQRAATLWYHDHRMDFTGPQVYRGLAGFHIVRDDEEAALPLPRGDHEVPLMITDRAFDADGAFRYPAVDPTLRGMPGVQPDYVQGVLGDVVLVNGAPWPVLDVGTGRYRLRILNASNARRYRITLSPALPLTQIGSDGGLLARPVSHQAIDIAPAERFDVVVDFSGCRVGQEITMTNLIGSGSTAQVMRFRVTHTERDDSRIPDRLSEIETLDPARATVLRDWRFTRGKVDMPGMPGMPGWLINGKSFDPTRMDANPKLGDVEIWRFHTDLHHPIHVHLAPFQVLHRDAGGPGEYDGGWKDTIDLKPAEQAEVAIRFTGYQGHYLLHCHNMEHEDMAMMSAFRTE